MNADAFSSITESPGVLPGHKDPGKIIAAREALDIFYKDDHLARAELGNRTPSTNRTPRRSRVSALMF